MRYHPLWTHTPAVVLIGMMAWRICSQNIPDRLPIHLKHGTGSASAAGVLGGILLLAALYLVMSVFFDESWAKNEQPGKSFNWMSLFDEITIAMLALSMWNITKPAEAGIAWLLVGGVIFAGCLAEIRRPYRAEPIDELLPLSGQLPVRPGTNWLFYQRQNPLHLNLIVIILGAIIISQVTYGPQKGDLWFGLFNVAIVGLLLSMWNGMRVSVSPSRISVRLGIINWKLMEITPDQVVSAEVAHFNPIRDFGGWGIRISRSKKGFFLAGNQGVLITPKKGMPVLIGSNQPQELLQAVQTALGSSQR